MKAFLGTTLGKVVIGVLAAAVVAGGGYGIYQAVQPDTAPTAEITEPATEPITTTEAEPTTEATTEATTTAAPTAAPTTTTTTITKAAAADPQVIEIVNTDTSQGWIAGPYKFAFDGAKWVFPGPHARGEFKIPDGYVLKDDSAVIARGGETVADIYSGDALWKQ